MLWLWLRLKLALLREQRTWQIKRNQSGRTGLPPAYDHKAKTSANLIQPNQKANQKQKTSAYDDEERSRGIIKVIHNLNQQKNKETNILTFTKDRNIERNLLARNLSTN